MPAAVTQIAPADNATALAHFESCLKLETDAWDVHEGLFKGADFVLIDARGPDDHAEGHIPSAVNIPHGKIIASRMSEYATAMGRVAQLARLGRPVKLMIGGINGWRGNGFPLERSGI